MVRVLTRAVALVPERSKMGDMNWAMPVFSRNSDTHCGMSFSVAR